MPTVVLCLIIVAAGAGSIYYIYFTEPEAERTTAMKDTAMLVSTVTPESGTFRPTIEAMGTVEPARHIILRPRVSGRVVERSDDFTPGGFVEEGDRLVRIDPSDYRQQLKKRKSALQQAQSDLKLERGRQDVAKQEFEMIEGEVEKQTNKHLVLRKPQLTSALAAVDSAKADVEQAELNLQRTRISAPFDAHILTRDVNTGSQVAEGDRLARLVGVDRFWIRVGIPLSELKWLPRGKRGAEGSGGNVRVRDRNAWPEGTYRTGTIHRRIGTVGQETRMAQVLVEISDPFARAGDHEDLPRLLIDSPVKVWIDGRPISNTVKLNREYLRKGDTVWVMTDGKLDIREVDVVTTDADYAYIRDGLTSSDQVVTTNLSTVTDGAALRTGTGEASSDSDTPDATTEN